MKKHTSKITKIIYSVVALVLMLMLLVSGTYSWLAENLRTQITSSDYITISADTGLEMNYGKDFESQGAININGILGNNITLSECSSVNGRNLFFPLSEYSSAGDGNFANGVTTNDLIFRESSGNDLNTKYIALDVSLTSESDTPVWLSKDSIIRNTDSNKTSANAVRVAFLENDPQNPTSIVFDAASDAGYVERNSAVSSISSAGVATTATCQTHAFNEYMYGNANNNQSLFQLTANEPKIITVVIWLEGTDAQCTEEILGLENLEVFIKFTTSFENVNSLTFIDYTLEEWVDDDNCLVFVIDNTDPSSRYPMTKISDGIWTVGLRESVTDVTFARFNPEVEEDWNTFNAGTIKDCSTYVAFGHNTGMWSNDFEPATITLFDGTPNGYLDDEGALMHIAFTVNDGNGDSKNFDYKMSYYNSGKFEYTDYENCWTIIVPSTATDITFKRYNSSETATIGNSWSNTVRGSNLFYTATASGTGYWSNKLLRLYDPGDIKHSSSTLAACFYTTLATDSDNVPGDISWSAMRAVNASGHYVVALPDGKTKVQFCRANPSAASYDIHNTQIIYNRTHDHYAEFGTKTVFELKGYWDNPNYFMWGDWIE